MTPKPKPRDCQAAQNTWKTKKKRDRKTPQHSPLTYLVAFIKAEWQHNDGDDVNGWPKLQAMRLYRWQLAKKFYKSVEQFVLI